MTGREPVIRTARFDRLLFRLSAPGIPAIASSGSVVLGVGASGAARVELQRGFVHALWREPAGATPSRAEETLRDLLRDAGDAHASFEPDAPGRPPRGHRWVTPFHPASVLRNHFEARLPAGAPGALRKRADREHLRLVRVPHPTCLGVDEQALIALLSVPRAIAELDAARIATPVRVERLLAFLEAAGALHVGPTLRELLGLDEAAPRAEVRRAYKRAARELHPDLHPAASERERRAMAERFARISVAWRALVGDDDGDDGDDAP